MLKNNLDDEMNKINTIAKRKKLPVMDKHPVWQKISTGKALGFMKLASGGVWRARLAVNGKHIHTTIGKVEVESDDGMLTYDDALKSAMKWFEQVEGTNAKYTLRECIDEYVDKLKLHNSPDSARRVGQRLNKHIPEGMMKTLVSRLTVDQLTKWRNGMVKLDDDVTMRRSKDSANRVLSMLKAALNYAYEREKVSNPRWGKVKTFPGVSSGKPLLLTVRQVSAILNGTTGGFHNLCKAAVLTGARYGELKAATVADFHPETGTITFRTRKGRGGVVRERDAMLSSDAVAFFKKLSKHSLPTAYLLTKDSGEPWGTSHQTRPWRNAVKMTAKNKVKADRVPATAVFYDLRHYHISMGMMARIPLKLIADNCGTSLAMIEKTYGKASNEYKRDAFNSLGEMLSIG